LYWQPVAGFTLHAFTNSSKFGPFGVVIVKQFPFAVAVTVLPPAAVMLWAKAAATAVASPEGVEGVTTESKLPFDPRSMLHVYAAPWPEPDMQYWLSTCSTSATPYKSRISPSLSAVS